MTRTKEDVILVETAEEGLPLARHGRMSDDDIKWTLQKLEAKMWKIYRTMPVDKEICSGLDER
jgi:hypothetical protein